MKALSAWAGPEEFDSESCGFVFAASGTKYAKLAEQAAISLKKSNPQFGIDIYTDCSIEPSYFDQIYSLKWSSIRPKFEALERSRFSRTIYLDCDLIVIGDLSDVFWILSKFEIAATHAPIRNHGFSTATWRKPIPNSFPQINGGLLGVRNSENTQIFLRKCKEELLETGQGRDQIIIRELLWEHDIRLAILPPEYNVRDDRLVLMSGSDVPAPRVLHSYAFSRRITSESGPPTPSEIYGEIFLRHVSDLIEADRQLTPGTDRRVSGLPVAGLRRMRDRISPPAKENSHKNVCEDGET